MARRLGALAVVGAALVAAVWGVGALLGGSGEDDDTVTSGTTASTTETSDDPHAAAPTAEESTTTDTTVAETTTTVAETTTERTGPPSSSEPARVLVVGDSDAGTFGPYLERLLDATNIVATELDYKVSSGLARPDFFDWPAALDEKIPGYDPEIVVVTFGGNDSQGLSEPGDELVWVVGDPIGNEKEWSAEYERRVAEVLDILTVDDRQVIWVGIPNDDNSDVTEKLAIQNDAVKAALEDYPEVTFIDTWNRFSGRDGNWAEFVIDPRDGEGKDVRADDGFHLNEAGAEILAIDIAQAVRDELRAMNADI